jgi:hypothetical protein
MMQACRLPADLLALEESFEQNCFLGTGVPTSGYLRSHQDIENF